MEVNTNLTAYLWCMGLGWALCAALYFLLVRKKAGMKKGALLAALALVFGAAFGLAGAKLLYLALRINILQGVDPLRILPEELSFFGGVAGATLGVLLAAGCAGVRPRTALNAFAPAGALMVAIARMSEAHLGMLGVGMYLEEGFFPYAQGVTFPWADDYTEWYLAVFTLEALFALAAAILSFLHRDEKRCFARTLFYICLPQVFCESLRENTISWLFVKAEQVVCFVYCAAVLIDFGLRTDSRKLRSWGPALTGLAVLVLTIAGEFALDKTEIPHWITYAVMLLGLAALAVAEHRGERMLRQKEGTWPGQTA